MTQKVSLTIPRWHAMALDGAAVPMRILIHGGSMYPLIRMDRDYVTILPLNGDIQAGDIVLMHDLRKYTSEAMEEIVGTLIGQGYQLVTVQELLQLSDGGFLPGHSYKQQ